MGMGKSLDPKCRGKKSAHSTNQAISKSSTKALKKPQKWIKTTKPRGRIARHEKYAFNLPVKIFGGSAVDPQTHVGHIGADDAR